VVGYTSQARTWQQVAYTSQARTRQQVWTCLAACWSMNKSAYVQIMAATWPMHGNHQAVGGPAGCVDACMEREGGGAAAAARPHLSAASRGVHHAARVQAQTGAPKAVRPLPRCGLHRSPGRPTACPTPRVHSAAAQLAGGGLLGAVGSVGRPPPANVQRRARQIVTHNRLVVRE
jgi:hypothetical protein